MEERYNRVRKAVEGLNEALDAYQDVQKDILALDKYESSGLWLRDYEADEKGRIPKEMPRGVLSQDGLYELLVSVGMLEARIQDYFEIPLNE